MFKKGDHVLYLNHFDCIIAHEGRKDGNREMYVLKQIDTGKIWMAHKEDIKLYEER